MLNSSKRRSHWTDVRRQRGAVLIVVLWVVVILSLLALSFAASIRTEVDAARVVVEQRQSRFMARAGIEYAIYEILQTQSAFFQSQSQAEPTFDSVPDVVRGHLNLSLSAGEAKVEVIDETGKLNINLAPDFLIFNLLLMIGIDGAEAESITNSILDWRDADDVPLPGGAESAYYQSLDPPYYAKNSLFDVPEELLLVKGVTPEIYYGKKTTTSAGDPVQLYGLQHYVTTFSNINRINVNSAPAPVIAAIPGLDYPTAYAIEAIRAEMPIADMSEITKRVPGISGEALNFFSILRSNVYTMISEGRLKDSDVVSQIRAVIRVDGVGRKGYAVLYWNEGSMEL